MTSILQDGAVDKLPVAELSSTLELFLEPVMMHLPEKRLQAVGKLAVQGVLGGKSPLVTQMARGVAREDETVQPIAKCLYRFAWKTPFTHRDLLKGLYGIGLGAKNCRKVMKPPATDIAGYRSLRLHP